MCCGLRRATLIAGSKAFAVAAVSIFFVCMASGLSSPMYEVYERRFHISAADVSASLVAYLAALIVSLGWSGRLADAVGRRKVAVPGLVLGTAASVVLTQVDSAAPLIAGRALQGMSSGVSLAALGALALDLSSASSPAIGVAIVSVLPPVGSAAGALASGWALPRVVHPTVTIYLCSALVLTACSFPIALVEEKALKQRESAAGVPSFRLPRRLSIAFVPAALAAAAAYNLGALAQALFPALVTEHFGSADPLVAAIAVAAAQITAPVGALGHRWRPRAMLTTGCVVLVVSAAGMAAALAVDGLPGFIVAAATGGLGFGLALAGGTGLLVARCRPDERGAALALLYLVAYLSSAVSILVAALVVEGVGLTGVGLAFCALIAAAASCSLWMVGRWRL